MPKQKCECNFKNSQYHCPIHCPCMVHCQNDLAVFHCRCEMKKEYYTSDEGSSDEDEDESECEICLESHGCICHAR